MVGTHRLHGIWSLSEAPMDDLYKDNSDVAFCVGDMDGTPILILHTTGVMLSTTFLGGEYTALRLRYLLELSGEEGGIGFKPTTFVCVDGPNLLSPLLACDPKPELQVLIDAEEHKKPWVLALQFVVEQEPRTRLFITTDNETKPIKGSLLLPRI